MLGVLWSLMESYGVLWEIAWGIMDSYGRGPGKNRGVLTKNSARVIIKHLRSP